MEVIYFVIMLVITIILFEQKVPGALGLLSADRKSIYVRFTAPLPLVLFQHSIELSLSF